MFVHIAFSVTDYQSNAWSRIFCFSRANPYTATIYSTAESGEGPRDAEERGTLDGGKAKVSRRFALRVTRPFDVEPT